MFMKITVNLCLALGLSFCELSIGAPLSLKTEASSELEISELGVQSLTKLPSAKNYGSFAFFNRNLMSIDPWQWRGHFAIGAPMQSFAEAVTVGTDQYLIGTLGGGIGLYDLAGIHAKWTLPVKVGIGSKPLVLGSSVIVAGMDATVRRLRLDTGKLEWQARLSAETLGGVAASMGLVYVNSADNLLWALDEKTGNLLWNYKRPGNEKPMLWSLRGQGVPKISLDGRRLYLGFSDGYFVCLDATSGDTLWERSFEKRGMLEDADTTPVLSRDGRTVFVSLVDGALLALKADTGVTLWSAPGAGSAYPPLLDDKEAALYAPTSTGVQKLDATTGNVIWAYSSAGLGLSTTPVFLQGKAIVFNASHFGVIVLSKDNGNVWWRYPYAPGLISQITTDGEHFMALSGRNRLHVFRAVTAKRPLIAKLRARIERSRPRTYRRNLSSPHD